MEPLLRMKDITKSFSGNTVLDNVSLELYEGEVHAILGENGAGKSTLIKILGGAYTKDSGEIFINGKSINIHSVDSAKKHGIRIIHQELMLIPYMSLAENIFLGQEPRTKLGLVDTNTMLQKAQELIYSMDMDLDASQPVSTLNIAQQQMIEIIRAISFGAKIIVMDEPTSSLTENEVETLFDSIRTLKEKKVGIIYISHRMSELDVISSKITVLRDGQHIKTVNTQDVDHNELVRLMVGRQIDEFYQKTNHQENEIVLEVKNLVSGKEVRNVNFDLKKGEVLGFSGLVGSGRTEVMKCIVGLRSRERGEVIINGKPVIIRHVKEAIAFGIGYVPEDRKKEGIFPTQNIRFNSTIGVLGEFLKFGRYDFSEEDALTRQYVDDVMHTKYTALEQIISKLSGGNQQKVIISRWLLASKSILILDEPTRGIDVKTKADIYHLIDDLTAKGMSVIFISSEMPELINMCDRIVVMNSGYSTGILERKDFSQEKIMALATKEIH